MFYNIKKIIGELQSNIETPLFKQIRYSIERSIEIGLLEPGERLPSINKLAQEYKLAHGTVIHAYEELRELGIVSSKQGKGYFISDIELKLNYRIFLLFDRISAYKEILYDSFRNEFGEDADIQVFFHHYDLKQFEKLVRENLGKYTHYVLMPHLHENVQKTITKIPEKKIIFLDNLPKNVRIKSNAVYQDFYNDIYHALTGALKKIKNYQSIIMSLSKSSFQFIPVMLKTGFTSFCNDNNLNYSIVNQITPENLKKNGLYIIFDDLELISTLKIINNRNWKLGIDIGIISFDETPMKEILAGGISVMSTDFVKMGVTAASIVKGKITGQIPNPFYLIERNSF